VKLEDVSSLLPNKTTSSVYDYEDMFLGAIVGGITDGEEITSKTPRHFIQKENILVFSIAKQCKELTGFCDYVAIRSEVEKAIGSVEAKKLLDKLVSKVPNEYSPASTGDKLEEFYVKRESSSILEMAKSAIQANPFAASEILYQAAEKLERITSTHVEFNLEKEFNDTVTNLLDGTAERMVVPTGLEFIDSVTGGIATQEVTFIGARPGHGKTTTCIGLAKAILATNPDKRVTIFELEMSKESLKRKWLCNEASVSSERMRLNRLTDLDKQALIKANETMSRYKDRLFIHDDIYDITSMNRIVKANKSDVVFVDFINFMENMQTDDARREMGRVAISAKRFAKMHNCGYVFYAQLNRQVEARETKRPEAGDLAESDLLTWIGADIILLLYKYKYTKDKNMANRLMWIFDKTRYAEVKDTVSVFMPDMSKIMDLPKMSTVAPATGGLSNLVGLKQPTSVSVSPLAGLSKDTTPPSKPF